jgi:predicted TIM-barrel fold metal-dependent hydrolase
MKRIAIEEHFYTQEYIDYLKSIKEYWIEKDEKGNNIEHLEHFVLEPGVMDSLVDVSEGRLKHMEEAGIDMQVLSFNCPGVEKLDSETGTNMAKRINNELAEIIKGHPDKFAGFAALAYQDPVEAAKELERAVKGLGLKGTKLDSHLNGEFLDDQKFWPIFEKAEKLGVPVYIHPKLPPQEIIGPYLDYPALAGPMFGFGAEISLHVMRLICSGLFDKYPGLKIILGHLGEALPFWLWRLDKPWRDGHKPDPKTSKLKKRPSQYIKDNFFVTTSGMFFQPALLCVLLSLGADKILFAADHPWEKSKNAVKFMEEAGISDADKEKIYHQNVETLLGL